MLQRTGNPSSATPASPDRLTRTMLAPSHDPRVIELLKRYPM
jgi:hypothetical protein